MASKYDRMEDSPSKRLYHHTNTQFITLSERSSGHECSWGKGALPTRSTCPICLLPALETDEKATTLDVLAKVLAELSASDLYRRMLAKLSLLSWTSTAKSLGINILGVDRGTVTYHLGVPRLQTESKITTFWPDMPATVETEVIMEAVDKAMGTSVIERQRARDKERKEGIRCLEERNQALEKEVASLKLVVKELREREVAIMSVRILKH